MRIKTRIATMVAVVLAAAGQTVAAQADFGVQPENFTTTLAAGQPGAAAEQAGGHPDFTTHFSLNLADPADPTKGPVGSIKDLDLDLPRGFVANPTPFDQCTMARVMDTTGQFGQLEPCPRSAAVGYASAVLYDPTNPTFPINAMGRVYRVKAEKGEAAAFAFSALFVPVRLGATVGPDGKYRIRASVRDLSEAQPLIDTSVTLWGVPADHQGPGDLKEGYQFGGVGFGLPFNGPLPGAERTAFTSLPGRCDAGPLVSTLTLTSWQTKTPTPGVETTAPAPTGCAQLPFDPAISVRPTNAQAGQPAGYRVDLSVPQAAAADRLSTANLKDAIVTLPKGTAISPPAADGLDACTDEQLKIEASADETCPSASKIGTVAIDSPLLDERVRGTLYVGQQLSSDPESGQMYRTFLTAKADGVKIKLRGEVKTNRRTGQITASFLDNPELPFTKFSLAFNGGDRAILVNPPACGEFETTARLTSWGGQAVNVSSSFVIDQGCPSGKFTPTFTAGTLNAFAGSFSPFTTTVARTDADQDLSRITMTMPSGLLAAVGSVPLCSAANAAFGSCHESTRVGTTTVGAGTGGRPYFLNGKVFLAGPYKGAPFSLSIVVHAKAGPFDLGFVVVRAPLFVDAKKANAAVISDPLPQIVGGVPLHYRSVSVTLDRPGFMFNATSCQVRQIASSLESTGGAIATPAVPYQAQGCDKIKLNPKLDLEFTGGKSQLAPKGSKRGHPGVKAKMSWPFGDSGLKQVKVELPLAVALDADNAQGLCKPEQAAARACPESSIIGKATAKTQALHEPLTGPIYFVEGTRKTASGKTVPTFPKLWLKLQGEGIPLDLWADSDVNEKTNQLTTTFVDIPDAPISGFEMEIKSGKGAVLAATQNVCAAKKTSVVHYDGQNGGKRTKHVAFHTPTCKPQISSAKKSGSKLSVRVAGIGAGKLTLSAKGIKRAKRTIKSSDAATLKARLTKSTRSKLAKGQRVKLRVSVKFNPKKGKTVTIKKTVTLKGKKKASKKK